MFQAFQFERKLLTKIVLASLVLTSTQVSLADDAVDLGTVQSGAAADQNSAPYQAPTQSSLGATQPESSISQHYIQQNASAGSNYTDLANIAPAVTSVDPNGPGMMETQAMTLRGFNDGQYNVTFDGIPWGDSNDFTHHSTSYFTAQDLGGIDVERGPGDASNIGDATFGGTIAVTSKNPMSSAGFTPYASYGSYNTRLIGGEFDTGTMTNYGDATAFIDYKYLTTDGFLTNGAQRRGNTFIKFIKPVSADTQVTFVSMKNDLVQNVPLGTTLANLTKYGYNYGLNNNPASQDYAGYNYDNISGDFEYLQVSTRQGNMTLDNKLYTYGYYHDGFNGADPGGAQPNGTGYGANNVPGQAMFMDYRSWGDLLRASDPVGSGDLQFGLWVDHQTNNRGQWNVDYTLLGALDPSQGGVNGYSRLMHDTLTTVQPYVQYAWKATDKLTITPGLKYSSFTRTDDSPVNQGTLAPINASQRWSKALPALTAHYKIQPNWTAYVQYAKGFLAPNLNTFYATNAVTSSMLPTQTTNYQVGTTWKDRRLTASADVYKIASSNWMTTTVVGTQTYFTNAGDVDFSGAEGEATYYVGKGFSVYGNYALISYHIRNTALYGSSVLMNVPRTTSAAGVIYNEGQLYASLLGKEIGRRYSNVDVNGNPIPMSAYTIVNFNTSYTIPNKNGMVRDVKIGFQINNLFNKQGIFSSIASDANGNPMFYVLPNRYYQLSLSGSF
jgi:iron complex outermembrane recepter protein